MIQVRVIEAYQAIYPDPISVRAGEEVVIDEGQQTDIAGWVWCTNRQGKSGWTAEAYFERRGERGVMRCDYDAIELTTQVGEILTVHKVESGFLWAINARGQTGWVPESHLEPVPTDPTTTQS